jgi:hypothetical protein
MLLETVLADEWNPELFRDLPSEICFSTARQSCDYDQHARITPPEVVLNKKRKTALMQFILFRNRN